MTETATDIFDPSKPLYAVVDGPVGTVMLNRPDKRNAFTTTLWHRLIAALTALEASSVRVIMVRSTSITAFSGGADIAELGTMADNPEKADTNRKALRAAQGRLATCIKPTVAVIPGACFGAGCGLALHADMRVASTEARFGITPAKLGLIYPLRDTARLVSIVGPARAKYMLYGAKTLTADEAYAFGMLEQLVSPDALDTTADQLAADIAALSPTAILAMKRQFAAIDGGQHDDDEASAAAFVARHGAPDMRAGVAAFLGKRAPEFADAGEG